MIDGEATVKELSVTGGHVWLLPHNADYSPPGWRHSLMWYVRVNE